MPEVIYTLCATTSVACAVLLLNGYREGKTRLLLWSGICFVGLALNNILLFVDVTLQPGADYSLPRSSIALVGIMVLLFGLVWERE